MEFKLGADFNNGFENTEPKNIKIALLQDGQSIINNEPCCDTLKVFIYSVLLLPDPLLQNVKFKLPKNLKQMRYHMDQQEKVMIR